jgi:hypothetical protein
MAAQDCTRNENGNYAQYVVSNGLGVEDYSKRELKLPDGFQFSSQHRSVASPKG